MVIYQTIKVGFKEKRLWTYFEKKAVITKSQNGFTKNKSCQFTLHPSLAQRMATYKLYHSIVFNGASH